MGNSNWKIIDYQRLAGTAVVASAGNDSTYRTILFAQGAYANGAGGSVAYVFASDGNIVRAPAAIQNNISFSMIYLAAADYPTVGALTTKLRIRAQLLGNDVANAGNFTFGLYPFTRPASSGAANQVIITLGTVVSGSDGATISTPAADSSNTLVGSDFAFPADGWYCLGVVITASSAVASQATMNVQLQMRNT
jgi:hypothetical protein